MKKRILSAALAAATLLALVGCAGSSSADSTPEQKSATTAGSSDSARSWADIQKSGVLHIGTITDYPPNEFKTDDGTPTGWAVELVEAIAKKLDLKVDYELLLFDNILPRIEGGAIDLGVGSFTDTREREKVVDFVNYYSAGTLWAAPKGSKVDPDNACGLKIAVMTGATQQLTELPERSKKCESAGKQPIEILPYTGQPEVTNAVLMGAADAFSADSPVTIDAIDALDGKLEIVGDMFDTAPYGFPVPRGSELAEPVRGALQELIDDGTYEKLLKKYHSESGAVTEAKINAASE
ncbi:ABC transporter substrate-binding protein [Leucobacter viscericola]|uniref:ABC transporter substrate-binding protein n=1 Tax=Leucobacter viscericola TaxID=2714935 RepID=A0A6G7XCC3_9MICO|nr:ABC transporter substrate-binding protein [Leucobacter viscericola]QIK62018.1 ABC transporter substrate-binding protein [Leucobacter viscericola]